MKKHLGVAKLLEKDVPQHLDAVILAHAAINLRRQMRQRFFRIAAAAATLLITLSGIGFALASAESETVIQQVQGYSRAELLAMTDFTTLEQENYAVDFTTSAGENMFDSYI